MISIRNPSLLIEFSPSTKDILHLKSLRNIPIDIPRGHRSKLLQILQEIEAYLQVPHFSTIPHDDKSLSQILVVFPCVLVLFETALHVSEIGEFYVVSNDRVSGPFILAPGVDCQFLSSLPGQRGVSFLN